MRDEVEDGPVGVRSRTVEVTPAGLWSDAGDASGSAAARRRPSTSIRRCAGSTCWPASPPAVDRDPAGRDELVAAAPRRDAGGREDLRDPLGRHQFPAVSGSPPAASAGTASTVEPLRPTDLGLHEPHGDLELQRRQLVERGDAEPLEELEARAVQDRPAVRLDRPPVDDEARCIRALTV